MIEIFIPILVICMNGTCEFMQPDNYYTQESLCVNSLDKQKEHMRGLAARGNVTIAVLEGTCANAKVKPIKGKEA
jgi:hypothetical protein